VNPRNLDRLLLGLLLAVAAGALWVQIGMVNQPLTRQLCRQVPDDAFFYFTIARTWAATGRLSIDGVHLASGFHPLWLLIIRGLIQGLPNADSAVRVALFGCAFMYALSGLQLYRLIAGFSSKRAAYVGCILYFLNCAWLSEAVNGLETSLTMLLLLATLASAQLLIPGSATGRGLATARLGVLGGLLCLARTDYAICVGCLILFGMYQARDSRKDWFLAGCLSAIILLVWLIFSRAVWGLHGQSSSYAYSITLWSHAYRPDSLWMTLRAILSRVKAGMVWFAIPDLGVPLLALVVLVKTLWKAGRSVREAWMVIWGTLWVSLGLFLVLHGGIRLNPRPWYFMMAPILGAISGALAVDWIADFEDARLRGVAAIALAFLVAYSLRSGIPYVLKDRYANQACFARGAEWVNRNLPPGTPVGVFNAGIIGYYSTQPILNLDGIVNDSVLPALRERQLLAYMDSQGTSYVLDQSWSVRFDYLSFWGGADGIKRLEAVALLPDKEVDGNVEVFRVKPLH